MAGMFTATQFSPAFSAWLSGLVTGLGLFAAVGAQSAFILRQGLMRAHVISVLMVCALADAILIFASVLSLRALTGALPWLMSAVAWCGVVFLTVYAIRAAHRALRARSALVPADSVARSRKGAVLGALAFTLLNPHFWIDMALVGSLAHGFGTASLEYASGAICASVLWLLALGTGARLLAPVFRDARAWRLLDGSVAVVMAGMALRLALRAI